MFVCLFVCTCTFVKVASSCGFLHSVSGFVTQLCIPVVLLLLCRRCFSLLFSKLNRDANVHKHSCFIKVSGHQPQPALSISHFCVPEESQSKHTGLTRNTAHSQTHNPCWNQDYSEFFFFFCFHVQLKSYLGSFSWIEFVQKEWLVSQLGAGRTLMGWLL